MERSRGASIYIFGWRCIRARNSRGWYFGDGSFATNATSLSPAHIWTNAGNYTATIIAYNSDHTNGVSASVLVHVPLIAPTFLSVGLNGTNFTMNLLGQSNVGYRVEYATNLTPPVTWRSVTAPIINNSNLIQVIDRMATNATRFYRVRIP